MCSICSDHEIAPRHSVCRIMFLSSRTRRIRAAPPDSKKVSQMYFGKDPVPGSKGNLWKCTCGTVRRQNIKLGYANVLSHIKLKHPNYLEVGALAQQSNKEKTQDLSTASSTVSGSAASLKEQSAGGNQHQMIQSTCLTPDQPMCSRGWSG